MSRTQPTYTLEVTVGGGANTFLLGLLNNGASGKSIKVWRYSISVPDSSGTDVVIDYELRKITALSGGTDVTPARMRTAYGDSSGITAKSLPATATDIATEKALVMHSTHQLNQAQNPQGFFIPVQAGPECEPLVLEEGQGVVIKQIDANTATVRVGLVYTQEDK